MQEFTTETGHHEVPGHDLSGANVLQLFGRHREKETLLNRSVDSYLKKIDKNTHGPQLEGLDGPHAREALNDPRTRVFKMPSPGGEVSWPLLAPMAHNVEYRQQYFGDKYDDTFYFSTPFPTENPDRAFYHELAEHLKELAESNTLIVCDYEEGVSHTREQLDEAARVAGVTMYDTTSSLNRNEEPRVVHFSGFVHPTERSGGTKLVEGDVNKSFQKAVELGELQEFPENGPAIILPERIANNTNDVAESLWVMYKEQFDRLVETHPSMQSQTKEDLLGTSSHPDTINVGHFQDGKIVGYSSFTSVENCYWLDPDYYRKRFSDEKVLFSPDIVVKYGHEGGNLSISMISYLANLVNRADFSARLTFQCTNISAQYVPKIVTIGLARHGEAVFEDQQTMASYKYDVLRLQRSSPAT